jgi:hypothetical protein
MFHDLGANYFIKGGILKRQPEVVALNEKRGPVGFAAVIHLAQYVLGLAHGQVVKIQAKNPATGLVEGEGMPAFTAPGVQDEIIAFRLKFFKINRKH